MIIEAYFEWSNNVHLQATVLYKTSPKVQVGREGQDSYGICEFCGKVEVLLCIKDSDCNNN